MALAPYEVTKTLILHCATKNYRVFLTLTSTNYRMKNRMPLVFKIYGYTCTYLIYVCCQITEFLSLLALFSIFIEYLYNTYHNLVTLKNQRMQFCFRLEFLYNIYPNFIGLTNLRMLTSFQKNKTPNSIRRASRHFIL